MRDFERSLFLICNPLQTLPIAYDRPVYPMLFFLQRWIMSKIVSWMEREMLCGNLYLEDQVLDNLSYPKKENSMLNVLDFLPLLLKEGVICGDLFSEH